MEEAEFVSEIHLDVRIFRHDAPPPERDWHAWPAPCEVFSLSIETNKYLRETREEDRRPSKVTFESVVANISMPKLDPALIHQVDMGPTHPIAAVQVAFPFPFLQLSNVSGKGIFARMLEEDGRFASFVRREALRAWSPMLSCMAMCMRSFGMPSDIIERLLLQATRTKAFGICGPVMRPLIKEYLPASSWLGKYPVLDYYFYLAEAPRGRSRTVRNKRKRF